MTNSSVRVLVADDFAPFRRFVASIAQEHGALQIVCEVSDGLEAVRKAKALQPDLILLDIGIPSLNGIEAARRIGKVSPISKILFLSQETSLDVVQAALSTGAMGYVCKADAGSELLTAINAILRGEKFVGERFAKRVAGVTRSQPPTRLGRNAILTPLARQGPGVTHRHEVAFYSDDASFSHGFAQFIRTALKAGNAVIVVATKAHRDGLHARLQAHGLDIGAAIKQGRYIALDAAHTLSTLMVNGVPEPARFLELAGELIMAAVKSARGEHPRVAVCGECDPPLWKLGTGDAAIQFEQLWNQIAAMYEVDILCGYPLGPFQSEQGSGLFQRICAEHSAARLSGAF